MDHFGGVKGVISQEQVDKGEVKVFAPQGFINATFDENIMAGNAMSRRAFYSIFSGDKFKISERKQKYSFGISNF